MPSITWDGQSFSNDGRRFWIVSGTLHYARMHRGLWGARLHAARQAGLNCIETPTPWNLHEPRPGASDFTGDLDLPAFLRAAQQNGLNTMLRIGPFIGDGYDMGGLPAWLLPECAGKLRSPAPEFLQPVARYFGALCDKVRDFQATSAKKSRGSLIAVLCEHQWFCGDSAAGDAYLSEIDRYLRENGIDVPIIGAHNLYHSVEGQVDAWSGRRNLHENMRQLRFVKPTQPRLIAHLPVGERPIWGRKPDEARAPMMLLRELAEVLAAGAQFNLSDFHAGTSWAFRSGRIDEALDAFVGTGGSSGAVLGESGERGPIFDAARRICCFASHFGRIFAALDPTYQPAIVSLAEAAPPKEAAKKPSTASRESTIALECRGSQGNVVFIFGQGGPDSPRRSHKIVLGDGSTLPITLEQQPVAWALFDTHLQGQARLDYCNLCALALVGSVFVCYGPAGAPGMFSINGSAFDVVVPEAKSPLIEAHEGVTLVVCNEEVIDKVHLAESGVFIGVRGISASGEVEPHKDFKKYTRISPDGTVSHHAASPRDKAPARPAFEAWSAAGTDDFIEGSSERYASIDAPAPMHTLGSPAGYGWMRLKFKSSSVKTLKATFHESADRLHVFLDGESLGIVGVGHGAVPSPLAVHLKAREHTLCMLIDNMGRHSEGSAIGELKGLYGDIWAVKPIKAGTPRLESGPPVSPLAFRSPIFGLHADDTTDPRRITWKIEHRKKTPIFMSVDHPAVIGAAGGGGGTGGTGLILVNGVATNLLVRGALGRFVIHPEQLGRGVAVIQIALMGDAEQSLAGYRAGVSFYEGEQPLAPKGTWAYAKWEVPSATKFKPLVKPAGSTGLRVKGRPMWWKGTFTLPADTSPPLYFEATGLSKGQLFLNGQNTGRYFVSSATGKLIPPQSRYYLPEPWLKPGAVNEIVLFDEHGFSPDKCKLVWADTE